jgi:hypothetical protein
MTHRVFRRAALAAVAALTAVCWAAPADASSSALPMFDITGVYVTGRRRYRNRQPARFFRRFHGHATADFAVKTAPQMVTIMNMVSALGG